MIEVGDKVKIVDPEETYLVYSDMFKKLGFKNRQRNGFWEDSSTKTLRT